MLNGLRNYVRWMKEIVINSQRESNFPNLDAIGVANETRVYLIFGLRTAFAFSLHGGFVFLR